MPVSDLDATTVPEGLPADLAPSWSTAIASLTDRELSAVVLRFGFRTGKPETFGAIGRELGENRVRARAIFSNALGRLGRMEETRTLARYLADLNAALSEEGPAERASRPVPVIEDIDGEEAADSVRAAPMRDEPIAEPDSPDDDADLEDSADDNSTVDQDEPADREEEVDDEPVSERDALKLVRAADRELARAIEQCVGREELLAELQRARTRIAAGMREIEQTPTVPAVTQVSSPTGKRRDGRPFNLAENERRAALLARLVAGEITNAEAAAELGIKASAWSSWKVLHRKRIAAVEGADRSHERTSARRGRGRPANVLETARRAAVFERVQAGVISNAEAAAELGITYAAWSGWRALHAKRAEVTRAPIARASVQPPSIPTEKRGRGRPVDPARLAMLERVRRGELRYAEAAAELGIKLTAWSSWMAYHSKRQGHQAVVPRTRAIPDLARLDDLEHFGRQLKERVRAMIELVEEWLG